MAVAAIGLTMGRGDSNPKPALGLIFGVVAVFEDPTAAGEAALWAGLAVTERPRGGFGARFPAQPGLDYRLRGSTVLSGE